MESYCYASPPSSASASAMNKYWIPHKDIHKKVITTHIQYYLGPDATVRSYTKDGEDGFLITTPGDCLTDEQIDDLCIKSMEMWERQAAARSADGTPNKALKRPLHQPVVIARAGPRAGADPRGRRPSSRNAHHHSRHYSYHHHNQPYYAGPPPPPASAAAAAAAAAAGTPHLLPPQSQTPQPPPQLYSLPQHHRRRSSSGSQVFYHPGWEPLSPTQDGNPPMPEGSRVY